MTFNEFIDLIDPFMKQRLYKDIDISYKKYGFVPRITYGTEIESGTTMILVDFYYEDNIIMVISEVTYLNRRKQLLEISIPKVNENQTIDGVLEYTKSMINLQEKFIRDAKRLSNTIST